MVSMNRSDWAWLAGLFEGEGNISTISPPNSVKLTIVSTDLDVLEQVKSLTGIGHIYERKVSLLGKKVPYSWELSLAQDVEWVLEGMREWFGERRGTDADAALERVAKVRKPGFCKNGHPLEGDNLYVRPDGRSLCRDCQVKYQKEYDQNQPDCTFDGCRKLTRANGLCPGHNRQRSLGKSLTVLEHRSPRKPRDVADLW